MIRQFGGMQYVLARYSGTRHDRDKLLDLDDIGKECRYIFSMRVLYIAILFPWYFVEKDVASW